MTYELAKELKEAGFPQLGDGFALCLHNPAHFEDLSDQTLARIPWNQYVYSSIHNTHGDDVYAPTLSELIEACKERMRALYKSVGVYNRNEGVWIASDQDPESSSWEDFGGLHCDGRTPEEAVARLWLAIRIKQSPHTE